jgi:polyisoprenoid-binding protein YceI
MSFDSASIRCAAVSIAVVVGAALCLPVGATSSLFAFAGPPFAEVSEGGKSLIVPDAHKGLGMVYYALPDRDVQVSFSSKAPVENIDGNSNSIIGYVIAGKDEDPAKLPAGEWHLPVTSLRTGIKLRDEHLRGENWIDAAKHPDIVFQLKEVTDIAEGKTEGDARSYTATLAGDMTIRGVTKPISITDATITFRKGSAATETAAKGDLLAIRAKYEISLSDYGVQNKVIGQKVAEVIKIDTNLVMSTVPPEEQAPKEADKPAR